ncbi:PsbP-related protein [Desulfosporosinus metallidurans]|uniref:Putative lipoprotein n=1 Tax=Desulfosporosinus metallidurans TaxID=1888891 RepID=A0A1Q8QZ54_9FIRM|nr:PsbP-related protein [Desulfosporosinus metallidurans]OLN32581.1 putative lipoprotein [Desulfosporosinus metallidurans]
MSKLRLPIALVTVVTLVTIVSGCGANSTASTNSSGSVQQSQQAAGTNQAAGTQPSPAGDIPDNQLFVNYVSQAGSYSLDVPEGWARTAKGSDVSFKDKLNSVQVVVAKVSSPPTLDSVNKSQVVELKTKGRAVKVKSVKNVNLPGGSAVVISYEENSVPDPVTGKQDRLENNQYFFTKNGEMATLTLSAPLGADNVDQWNKMSGSFRWR